MVRKREKRKEVLNPGKLLGNLLNSFTTKGVPNYK